VPAFWRDLPIVVTHFLPLLGFYDNFDCAANSTGKSVKGSIDFIQAESMRDQWFEIYSSIGHQWDRPAQVQHTFGFGTGDE
jgi:hypothetical protein